MGTLRYTNHLFYLLVTRDGQARVVRRMPWQRKPGEYTFRLTLRIPQVDRPVVEGDLSVELPPDVDADGAPAAEIAGPVE